MSRTMNRVELLGRVGTDPELRYTQSGTAVAQLRLATDRRRQNGEVEADWHNITAWGKTAEIISEHVGKGERLLVTGKLVNSSYETPEGERRYRTEVHAAEVIFLGARSTSDPDASARQEESQDGAGAGSGEGLPF